MTEIYWIAFVSIVVGFSFWEAHLAANKPRLSLEQSDPLRIVYRTLMMIVLSVVFVLAPAQTTTAPMLQFGLLFLLGESTFALLYRSKLNTHRDRSVWNMSEDSIYDRFWLSIAERVCVTAYLTSGKMWSIREVAGKIASAVDAITIATVSYFLL